MIGPPFRYKSGEVVCLGDRVISCGRRYGVVVEIALAGTEAADAEQKPEGCVTVAEETDGLVGYWCMAPSKGRVPYDWDETVFLRRGSAKSMNYGGRPPWPYEKPPVGLISPPIPSEAAWSDEQERIVKVLRSLSDA